MPPLSNARRVAKKKKKKCGPSCMWALDSPEWTRGWMVPPLSPKQSNHRRGGVINKNKKNHLRCIEKGTSPTKKKKKRYQLGGGAVGRQGYKYIKEIGQNERLGFF